MEANIIEDVTPEKAYIDLDNRIAVYGFPWGFTPKNLPESNRTQFKDKVDFHIAMCHQYVWWGDCKYPSATEEQHIGKVVPDGYNAVVFGDNHKGFFIKNRNILNCGTFIRRKTDEMNYTPSYGVVIGNKLEKRLLDCSKDEFLDIDPKLEADDGDSVELSGLVAELAQLGDAAINFHHAVRQLMDSDNSVSQEVKNLLNSILAKTS